MKIGLSFAAWYFVASMATFIAYAIDKSAARRHDARIAESTLHWLSLAGGWPGAIAAQAILRHKSRKQPFRMVFGITVLLNCCLLVAMLWFLALFRLV